MVHIIVIKKIVSVFSGENVEIN